MYLIRLLIIFFIFVQFTSSISSSTQSSVTSINTSATNKSSTETIKPKTSFTRHLTKIFSPLKKLFSPKSKTTTPLPLIEDNLNQTNSIDKQLSNESIDQLNLTNNETNQTSLSNDNFELIGLFDSIDFNLTDETSSRKLDNSSTTDVILINFENHKNDENRTEDVSNEEINLDTNNQQVSKDTSSTTQSTTQLTTQLTTQFINFEISSTSSKTITVSPFTSTTQPPETTTNPFHRKRVQKLKEDEIKICFEIEELNLRKCYIQIPNTSNFVHSRNYCETHFSKGKLITINSVDEQTFLILNSVYYFWTALKVKLGLTANQTPLIAAIRPVYKQSNISLDLIKQFNFNQNLVISQAELKNLVGDEKLASYQTNDDDAYEEDDVRLEESAETPIYVVVPKTYCLEASLSFEDGHPLYKWVVKDCDQETSSAVCELSEQLLDEEEENESKNDEKSNKPFQESKTNDDSDEDGSEDAKLNKNSKSNDEFVDSHVNKLVNDFLKESSLNSLKTNRPRIATEPPNIEIKTESSEDEHFKAILNDLLREDETTTAQTLFTTQQILTTTLSPIAESATTIHSTTLQSINYPTTTSQSIEQKSTQTISSFENIELITNESNRTNQILNTNSVTKSTNSTSKCTPNEQNPLIYQFMFALNIAFNSFCALISNLFSKDGLNENQLKHSKLIFLSAIILLLLLLLTIVLLLILITCRYATKILRRKRRLLLDQLSKQRYKKDQFNVSIEDKYDNNFYYNIPHNRNVYVTENKNFLLDNNNERYTCIPKDYFY